MIRKFLITVAIAVLSYTGFFLYASAQIPEITIPDVTIPDVTNPASNGTASVSLSSNAPTPQPFQTVTLTVSGSSVNLEQSTITWTVNGKKVESATGDITHDVTLGTSGSATNVSVLVTAQDGTQYSNSLKIIPANVTLLWQANSYTPLFYKGKALFPIQGTATITALPDFGPNTLKAGSKNYIFTWKKNNGVEADVSGYGKDTYTLTSGYDTNPTTIEVDVSNIDGSIVASNSITINPITPYALFYNNDPLYGTLYNQAILNNYNLFKTEINLQAVPYFFGTTENHIINPLTFSWMINGDDAGTKTTNTVTLRQPGNTSGQSNVSINVKNPSNDFQIFSNTVTINYTPSN